MHLAHDKDWSLTSAFAWWAGFAQHPIPWPQGWALQPNLDQYCPILLTSDWFRIGMWPKLIQWKSFPGIFLLKCGQFIVKCDSRAAYCRVLHLMGRPEKMKLSPREMQTEHVGGIRSLVPDSWVPWSSPHSIHCVSTAPPQPQHPSNQPSFSFKLVQIEFLSLATKRSLTITDVISICYINWKWLKNLFLVKQFKFISRDVSHITAPSSSVAWVRLAKRSRPSNGLPKGQAQRAVCWFELKSRCYSDRIWWFSRRLTHLEDQQGMAHKEPL